MHSKPERQQAILNLLGQNEIHSQAELQELLEAEGYTVNQGTLSRDLRELGVLKGPDGYHAAGNGQGASPSGSLQRAASEWLESATKAQNLLVLKTPPGGAQPLALALDGAGLDDIVGTVAGDDTLMVVCPSERHATRAAKQLLNLRNAS